MITGWTLEEVNDLNRISALDLREEIERPGDTPFYCYLVHIEKDGKPGIDAAQMVYFPEYGRAGIAWGADADWTDCDSAEDAVRRFIQGEMIP